MAWLTHRPPRRLTSAVQLLELLRSRRSCRHGLLDDDGVRAAAVAEQPHADRAAVPLARGGRCEQQPEQGSSSSHIGHGEEVQVFYTDDQEEWIADRDFHTVAWKKA